jgi:hypothetical protein
MNEVFPMYLILPAALGARVYSASNRDEYQKQKIMSFVREGALHEEERNCQANKIKTWSWVPKGDRYQDELVD